MNIYHRTLFFLLVLSIFACERTDPSATPPAVTEISPKVEIIDAPKQPSQETSINTKASTNITANANYKALEWTDLLPEKDLHALMNPPEYLTDVEDGSVEDRITSQIQAQLEIDENDPYQQALTSTNIIPEMDGQLIRLPGFVVPLEFGDKEFDVTQFFFVPFFGACIHLPPPPPNQVIFVNYPKSLKLASLQDAFWITGKLKTTLTENDSATSAYSIELHTIEPYDYDALPP